MLGLFPEASASKQICNQSLASRNPLLYLGLCDTKISLPYNPPSTSCEAKKVWAAPVSLAATQGMYSLARMFVFTPLLTEMFHFSRYAPVH